MNAEQRLNLISKIAQNAIQNDSIFFGRDELWLIGILSDTTMSDDKLKEEIEALKKDFPEYVEFLEKAIDSLQAKAQDTSTMIEITRNTFTKLSLLSNFWIEDDMVFHILIPYNTEQIELLTDNEIGQYMGGN